MLSRDAQRGEDAGSDARRSFGLAADQPIDDLLRVVERSTPLAIFFAPLGNEGPAGALDAQREQPFVLVNTDQDPVRMRFTLAHELGHFRLEHRAAIDADISFLDSDPREVQANFFAASFLMPAAVIDGMLGRRGYPDVSLELVCELADELGLSPPAMANRLATIGKLGRAAKAEFDVAFLRGEHVGRLRPPFQDSIGGLRGRFRVPFEMERDAVTAMRRERLPRDVVAQVLRINDEELEQLLSPADA